MNSNITIPLCVLLLLTASSCSCFQELTYRTVTNSLYKVNSLSQKPIKLGQDRLAYFDSHKANSHTTPRATILLIHGVTADKESWLLVARKLKKKYRVIGVDLSGHGESPNAIDEDYTFARQAKRIQNLIEQLGIKKVHLLGHSMGGGIAMKFAVLYPEHTASLGLISSAGATNQETSKFNTMFKIRNPLIVSETWSAYDKFKFVTKSPILRWGFKVSLSSYFTQRDKPREADYAFIYDTISKEVLSERELKRISQPTFILWGKHDAVIKVDQATYYWKNIPGAVSEPIKLNSGHTPIIERARCVAKEYLLFLSRIPK